MKSLWILLFPVFLVGCASTEEWEYNVKTGKLIKHTKSIPLVGQVIESTKNKVVYAYGEGLSMSFVVAPGTTENPMPHVEGKFKNGKGGVLTMPKELTPEQGANVVNIVNAINAKNISLTTKGVKVE